MRNDVLYFRQCSKGVYCTVLYCTCVVLYVEHNGGLTFADEVHLFLQCVVLLHFKIGCSYYINALQTMRVKVKFFNIDCNFMEV